MSEDNRTELQRVIDHVILENPTADLNEIRRLVESIHGHRPSKSYVSKRMKLIDLETTPPEIITESISEPITDGEEVPLIIPDDMEEPELEPEFELPPNWMDILLGIAEKPFDFLAMRTGWDGWKITDDEHDQLKEALDYGADEIERFIPEFVRKHFGKIYIFYTVGMIVGTKALTYRAMQKEQEANPDVEE